jgi:hypothetical protein
VDLASPTEPAAAEEGKDNDDGDDDDDDEGEAFDSDDDCAEPAYDSGRGLQNAIVIQTCHVCV